ncbi:PREDICTED: LOW QUALITY PROTEIN: polyketide synthase PksN-like [Gekko japonicus]|uniref:LOW QUALITY PROTEIN: polyketide synthase PksN-like n=1 Tax=Gekko japonicus TaxID=146911 RepID=A0ABM1KNS7_GEKJA|nr:PREDICTED: LOW QUALITY PROTEIN: polyketide synthase PksN-like [Gekko japonicus]
MKQKGSLGIISTEPESVLCKVLHLSAQEAGWKNIRTQPYSNLELCADQCNALIFLPPLERLPKAVLGSLSKLQDVVVICDNRHAECLRALIGMDHENFQIHILSLTSIFQKASLKKQSMPFSSWMKSLEPKQSLKLPCSVFQQTGKSESMGSSASSHLTRKAVPFVMLKGNVHSNFSDIPLYRGKRKMFKEKAVYIVTGGLTGLGFETVRFIAENGGGGIVFLSRRKPGVEKQKEIKDLQHRNKRSKIIALQCNVIFRSDVEKAISVVSKIFPKCPIKGVFHSAVVLHDGSIEALTISDFEEVFSPKVAGAMNLHHATQGQDLDYFVCYSSVASFLGNAMQANYAAANSFLDLFCHYRRNRGLAGQSINWGALNLGLPQNQNEIQNFLESKGIAILQVNDFYEYLKRSLILNNPQQAIIKFNFKNLTNYFISQNPAFRNRMHSVLMELSGGRFELSEQTVSQDLTPVKNEDYIMALMSQLSGADPSDVAMNSSLLSNGIDSMLAMTLQNRIFQERRVNIPLVKLLDPNTTAFNLAWLLEEQSKEIGKSVK